MKVLLSVALWGRSYAETFVRYALASQLSPGNIPKLAEGHQVTYHVVTTHDDAAWMQAQPNFSELGDHCQIVWDFIEDLGFLLNQIPTEKDGEKYPFMSRLQNRAFERSLDHDVLIFNYADFIWADGSLPATVGLTGPEVDAVLSFCLPVDSSDGKQALDDLRARGEGPDVLVLAPRVLARIACDHLHAEARLRMWDGPEFTTTPTYLVWRVGDDGLVVRAYHQTILALRVKANDPNFRAGIRRGSLDGYFSAELAESGAVRFANDSDQVLVFSLYDATASTRLSEKQTREWALANCLRNSVSEGQRRFASIPIRIKRRLSDAGAWMAVEERSHSILAKIHDEIAPDTAAFLRNASDDIAQMEERWRVAPTAIEVAVRLFAPGMRKLGLLGLCLLRSLYVGRLLKILVIPLLAPPQQAWIKQVGARTPRLEWEGLQGAVSNLGAPVYHLLHFLVDGMSRALRIVGKISVGRARGRGE